MSKEINQLALDVSNDLVTETLAKGLPPKLLYRLRALAHKYGWKVPHKQIQNVMTNALTQKMAEVNNLKTLKKNEIALSVYPKSLKLDFGCDISEETKKKAISWCKQRGLSVIEESLDKSTKTASSVILGEPIMNLSPDEIIKWSC